MITREYTFYSQGFFGYGEKGNFAYWSWAHILPILLLVGAVAAVYFLRHRLRDWKWEENFRFTLGFVLLVVEMSYYWRLIYAGSGSADLGTLMTKMPIQVCQWMCILSSFMIMKKSRNLYSVCYFVCLTMGLVPMITPAVIVTTGPSYYRYYQFWLEHTLPVFSVLYLTFVHRFRVRFRDVWRPISVMAVLAALSIWGNKLVERANFMYLATNTEGDSLANLLPPNMYLRLALYGAGMLLLFALVWLPVHLAEKRGRTQDRTKRLQQ